MSNPPVLKLHGLGPARNVPPLSSVPADFGLVAQLVDMGFDQSRVVKALTESNNNLGRALDWLSTHMDDDVPVEILNESLLNAQPGVAHAPPLSSSVIEDFHKMKIDEPHSAIEVATLGVSSEPATVMHSRYNTNSKEAYRERQRQKELEKAKLEKQKQRDDAARIKAEIDRERQNRGGLPDSTSASEPESKEAFESKQKAKEAEENRKKKAQQAAELERLKRDIEAERQAKIVESGGTIDASAPKLTPTESKAAYVERAKEKEKEAWKSDQEANARRLAELRQQLKSDRERKKAQSSSSSSSSANAPTVVQLDNLELPEDVKEARKARLGITATSGQQAHSGNSDFSTPPPSLKPDGPFNHDENDMTAEQLKAKNKAKALLAAKKAEAASATVPASPPAPISPPASLTPLQEARENRRLQFEEQKQKEQEEEARRLRAERAQKMLTNTFSMRTTTPQSAPSMTASTEIYYPKEEGETTLISLRLPDGRIKRHGFLVTSKVRDVHEYAATWLPLNAIFTLLIPTPRLEFDDNSMEMTLAEAGLCPRGLLTVLTLQNRGIVTQAPPRPAHLARMMNMMDYTGSEMEAVEEYANMSYEELLELQERMGFVPKGMSDHEIKLLETSKYVPCEDGAFCVICQVDIEAGESITTLPSCKHIFHKDHIEQWLRDNRTCPACRNRVAISLTATATDGNDPTGHNNGSESNDSEEY